MTIPTNDNELKELIPKLPRSLQIMVTLWCYGHDVDPMVKGWGKSKQYRDRQILAEFGIDLSKPHPKPFKPAPPPTLRHFRVEILIPSDAVHIGVWHLAEKDGLFLSPRGRLAAITSSALLDSHSLALALAEHCLPRLLKKSESAEYRILETSELVTPALTEQIARDSKEATAYLERNSPVRPRS